MNARLYALGRHRRPDATGARDLDLDQLLASGMLEAHRRPGLWRRLVGWITGRAA